MKIWSALLFVLIPFLSLADTVVPIDKVQEHVNIRMSPDSSSEIVGRLHQGDSALLISSEGDWHEVALEGDASGYISADWTKVIGEAKLPDEQAEEMTVGELLEELPEDDVVNVVVVKETEVDGSPIEDVVPEEVVAEEVVAEEVVDADAAVEEVALVEVADETVVEEEATVDVSSETEAAPEANLAPMQPSAPAVPPAASTALIKGTRNFLVRFRDETEGGNSQIFDDGNQIGIGTTTPKQRLEVNGSIQIHEQNSSVAGLMITQSSGETGYIMHNRASTLTLGAGSEDRITIDRNGNVGMGVSRPKHPLEMASGAHVTAGGVWTNRSSREYKENVVALTGELATSALMELRPVQFNYRNEAGENYVGFIAEDVPELVAMNERDGLSPMDIVAVLTRVVQEQQKKIEALERRLDDR